MTQTETFTEKQNRLWIERALTFQKQHDDLRKSLECTLRVDPFRTPERLGDVIELDTGLFVVEVEGGPYGTAWRVVDGTQAHFNGWPDRFTAIISAIGLRHNAGDDAGVYAARVLNVPQDPEA